MRRRISRSATPCASAASALAEHAWNVLNLATMAACSGP